MRRIVISLSKAMQCIQNNIQVNKDYQKLSQLRRQLNVNKQKKDEYSQYPLRYQLLECKPGLPLAITKLKYLLACRRTHPQAGGNAEEFLRVSLAYQDVMKDYGVQTVQNQVVNLGNFQADVSEAQNYLKARGKIKSYIPVSTLEQHIQRIQQVKLRLGDSLSQKLAANDDDAMWLLQDIEDIMQQTGLKTAKLQIQSGDKINVLPVKQLTDGTQQPLFLHSYENNNKIVDDCEKICNVQLSCDEQDTHNVVEEMQHKKQQLITSVNQLKSQAQSVEQTQMHEKQNQFSQKIDEKDSKPQDNVNNCTKSNPTNYNNDSIADNQNVNNSECLEQKSIVQVSADDIQVLNMKNTLMSRPDVAGLAANAANTLMKSTREVRQIYLEGSVLLVLIFFIMCFIFICVERLRRIHRVEESRPQVRDHLVGNTMLPWWGNDEQYEAQVKRIFLQEWRQARSTARRTQTFQDGVARESLDDDTKKRLDLQVFTVTAEKLRIMRENAQKHPGRR